MVDEVIRMYGTAWCGDCKRAKRFLSENRVPYQYVDIDEDSEGERVVLEANGGKRIVPTIFFADGSVLVEPSNAELAEKLGLQTRPKKELYDLVAVGGGPASLTATIYAARRAWKSSWWKRVPSGGRPA